MKLTIFLFLSITASAQSYYQNVSALANIQHIGFNRGVAIADYDNDGDEDVYVSVHAGANRLYQNQGDGTFDDVANESGVAHTESTHAAIWGDLDNDGDLDLFLGNQANPNKLYQNNGDGTFTDISLTAGIANASLPKSLMLSDVNNDGFLDIYIANINAENLLYMNNGNMTFVNQIYLSGATDTQVSMGAVFCDYDNDGDADLYLTHDANQPNILYQNDGTGKFTDVTAIAGVGYAGFGMGVDFGDVNNDGWMDIYITNLYENVLYLNNGNGTFTNIMNTAQTDDYGMGWGTSFLDFDNDGRLDIYVSNDSQFSPYPNVLYRNLENEVFDVVDQFASVSSMGGGYGTACFDYNDDGRLDIFVANNLGEGNELFKNVTEQAGNWIKIKAIGTISNRSAIGTRIKIQIGDMVLIDEIKGGSGYTSQNSLIQHFGLADATLIDTLTLNWPSGIVQKMTGITANQLLEITETDVTTTINTIDSDLKPLIIFPTLVKEVLQVKLLPRAEVNTALSIYDAQGKFIKHVPISGQEMVIRLDNLPNGVYFLSMQMGEKLVAEKFIIER